MVGLTPDIKKCNEVNNANFNLVDHLLVWFVFALKFTFSFFQSWISGTNI